MAYYSGSLPTIFNIYDDLKQRSSQHEQAKESCGEFYYLQAPQNAFLPFEFELAASENVTEIKVFFDDSEQFCYDLTDNINRLHYRTLAGGNAKICFYYGNYTDIWANGAYLQQGRFYLQFKIQNSFGTRYKYSDTFEIPAQTQKIEIGLTSTKLIVLTFSDIYDFEGKNGALYNVTGDAYNPYFTQRIYLYTTQYQFKVVTEKEDSYTNGYGFETPSFQRVTHKISIEAIVPYSVYRGLSVASMCKTIQIFENERGRFGDVENMTISDEAIGEGAFYKLTITFDENIVIRKPC